MDFVDEYTASKRFGDWYDYQTNELGREVDVLAEAASDSRLRGAISKFIRQTDWPELKRRVGYVCAACYAEHHGLWAQAACPARAESSEVGSSTQCSRGFNAEHMDRY